MKIDLCAFAKINLLLDITGIKENGYHSLFTVMQSVGLYDKLTVEDADDGKITVTCSDPDVPTGDENTVTRCAAQFFDAVGLAGRGVRIHIEKHIPAQAGLGGGSTDGAAALVALNTLFDAGLSERELCVLGGRVGADIPFCIVGGTALALDTGLIVAPLPALADCCVVIVKPDKNVSTKEAYAAVDEIEIKHPRNTAMLDAIVSGEFETAMKLCANVFEQAVNVPGRVDIKHIMLQHGCLAACMSGSGSAVYGIFSDITTADACAEALEEQFPSVFVCEPKKAGCEILKITA